MLTDRQRIELRKWKEETEAFEKSEREEAERPVKEAERQLTETYRKLQTLSREAVLAERGDIDWKPPLELVGLTMDYSLAKSVNGDTFRQFLAQNQAFVTEYDCPEARDLLCDYLLRQQCQIANVQAFEIAFQRLVEAGVLQPKPKAEAIPVPVVVEEPEEVWWVEPEPEPEFYEGIDLVTRRPRTYTSYEVRNMGAEEYRRSIGLPRAPRDSPGV